MFVHGKELTPMAGSATLNCAQSMCGRQEKGAQNVFQRARLDPDAKKRFALRGSSMSPPKSPLDDLRIKRGAEQKPQPRLWLVVAGVVVLALMGAALWWHSRSGAVAVQTAAARSGACEGGERIVLNA